MLRKILLIILGFILGAMSILFVYGDLNQNGIIGLYQTYKTIKQKQKEDEITFVKEYMTKAIEPKNEKKEKNKWQKQIKHKKVSHTYSLHNFVDLNGNKIKEDYKKHLLIVGLPYSGFYALINNKSPEEYARIQDKNLRNILNVKELLNDDIDFRLSVSNKMYVEEFNSNPVKLIKYINKHYPKIDFPIYLENDKSGINLILAGTFKSSYLIDETFSDKYMEQLIYLLNNDNYNNKDLFPPKEYIMSKKKSSEAIKYYESIRDSKLTEQELKENNNIKPKIIGYEKKDWYEQ